MSRTAEVDWLTVDQVADELQISTRTVRRAIAAKRLVAARMGDRGAYRIRRRAVEAWVRSRSTGTVPRRRPSAAPPARRARRAAVAPLEITATMGRQ